jgi:hypothetical protein
LDMRYKLLLKRSSLEATDAWACFLDRMPDAELL